MPEQFWTLTPRELVLQQRGYVWRQEQEQWRMAHIIASMHNALRVVTVIQTNERGAKKATNRKPVTAAKILGKEKTEPHKSNDPMDHKRILDGLVKKTAHWKRRHPERKPRTESAHSQG
jgi:hypothetical protein